MKFTGHYYLHIDGSLIYKPFSEAIDLLDSDFVKHFWQADLIGESPDVFLDFLMEAQKLGAKKSEIKRLYEFNHLESYLPISKEMLGL